MISLKATSRIYLCTVLDYWCGFLSLGVGHNGDTVQSGWGFLFEREREWKIGEAGQLVLVIVYTL